MREICVEVFYIKARMWVSLAGYQVVLRIHLNQNVYNVKAIATNSIKSFQVSLYFKFTERKIQGIIFTHIEIVI